MKIKTKFRLSVTKTESENDTDSLSMVHLYNYIRSESLKNAPKNIDEFLSAADKVMHTLELYDDKKHILSLAKSMYKPYLKDQVTFILGEITDVKHYTKGTMHVMCRYFSNGSFYKGCFLVPEEQYNTLTKNKKPLLLIGTCIRKTYKVPEKKAYNSRSHSSYTVKPATEKERTKMISFTIIPK